MSLPEDFGYSVALTPAPFSSRITFTRGLVTELASGLQPPSDSLPKQRSIASCTSVSGPSFFQTKYSTGFWVPVAPTLSSVLPTSSVPSSSGLPVASSR